MKRILMTMALTCLIAVQALAGEIPTVGVASPAPTGTAQNTSTPSPGEIPSVGVADQTSSATLSALLTVLGLLGL